MAGKVQIRSVAQWQADMATFACNRQKSGLAAMNRCCIEAGADADNKLWPRARVLCSGKGFVHLVGRQTVQRIALRLQIVDDSDPDAAQNAFDAFRGYHPIKIGHFGATVLHGACHGYAGTFARNIAMIPQKPRKDAFKGVRLRICKAPYGVFCDNAVMRQCYPGIGAADIRQKDGHGWPGWGIGHHGNLTAQWQGRNEPARL